MTLSIDQNIQIKCIALYNDANKQLWIDNAELSLTESCYGDKYTLVVALRACHDYTMSPSNGGTAGASGAITSKREGDQAVTFSNNSSKYSTGDDYLSQTAYGRELLSIQKGTLPRLCVTGNRDETTNICCLYN